MSPIEEAYRDWKDGLGIDENPFLKDSLDWIKYRNQWNDLYLLELEAEQQPNYV